MPVDQARLQNELETLATFSDAPAPAVTRVLFTPTELKARQYVRDLMATAGLIVREDAVGNIFGRWIGADPNLSPIATGSHIDAIPHSGRYDGTVGVLGGIEAIRLLRKSGYEPKRSIDVIMFTAEEPTRFGIGCLGSRALAGVLSVADMQVLRDEHGRAFDDVRKEANYPEPLSTVRLSQGAYHAFVELHIEQGPRLEAQNTDIGVVTAIAAPATLRVVIQGSGGHAGTVLMLDRHDAFPAAAEIVLAVEQAAKNSGSLDSVATVGLCEVHPGAVNSIPSRVSLEVDIRDVVLSSRDDMLQIIRAAVRDICARRQLDVDMQVLNADAPSQSGAEIVNVILEASDSLGYSHQKMVSRAYHDTLFMAEICPTSMIFIPSHMGYSHRPDEYSSPEQISRGVAVLARTLRSLSS